MTKRYPAILRGNYKHSEFSKAEHMIFDKLPDEVHMVTMYLQREVIAPKHNSFIIHNRMGGLKLESMFQKNVMLTSSKPFYDTWIPTKVKLWNYDYYPYGRLVEEKAIMRG